MNYEVKVKYSEGYLPTPRCRKLRYRDAHKNAFVSVKEVSGSEAPVVCVEHRWDEDVEYRYHNGLFYTPSLMKDVVCGGQGPLAKEDLGHYLRGNYDYWNYNFDENLSAFQKSAEDYLLIDDVVYRETGEPRYVVMTFGLGHNHGGTSLMVSNYYNGNVPKSNYFSATEPEKAITYANAVASRRGDTNDVGKFMQQIEVFDRNVFRLDPQNEHGDGDPFINDLEEIVNCSGSTAEAGLLAIALAMSK